MFRESVRLYRSHDRSSRFSEWPHIYADLLRAAHTPTQPRQRLAVVERMMRTYAVFER